MSTRDDQSLSPITNEELLQLARTTHGTELVRLPGDWLPNRALDLQTFLDDYRAGAFDDERLIEQDPLLAPESQLQDLRTHLREVAGRGIVATVVQHGDEAVLLLATPTRAGRVPVPPEPMVAA